MGEWLSKGRGEAMLGLCHLGKYGVRISVFEKGYVGVMFSLPFFPFFTAKS